MTLLALTMTRHTGLKLAEAGELLGLVGGLALLLGGVLPFGKRFGQLVGGLALAAGFALLAIATHYGHFGHLH